jgi:hypothetical protein
VKCLLFAACAVVGIASGFDVYTSARHKVDLIESGRLQPGARVDLSIGELNAFAVKEAPAGVRNPKLVLESQERVSGTAFVDFIKLRRAQGYEPGWLMSKLFDGEHPVSATVTVHSGGGKVRVDVERASISGVEIDGKTLAFIIQNFILPFYPDAMVGHPFRMGFRIDRLQLAPAGVGVVIGQ